MKSVHITKLSISCGFGREGPMAGLVADRSVINIESAWALTACKCNVACASIYVSLHSVIPGIIV